MNEWLLLMDNLTWINLLEIIAYMSLAQSTPSNPELFAFPCQPD